MDKTTTLKIIIIISHKYIPINGEKYILIFLFDIQCQNMSKKGEKCIGLSGAGATPLGILILTETLLNTKRCC